MTARWDHLPVEARESRPRRRARRATWRCHACGEVLRGVTFPVAERHADTHGGARLDRVLEAE